MLVCPALGQRAHFTVGFQQHGDAFGGAGGDFVQAILDGGGDVGKADAAVKESGNGGFVGGVENAGGAAAFVHGAVGQAQAGEALEIGNAEGEIGQGGEIEPRGAGFDALGQAEAVGDGGACFLMKPQRPIIFLTKKLRLGPKNCMIEVV